MSETLRRYTDVLSVIDIVRERRLTLLTPQSWPDRNDALGLELYRKLTGSVAIYACCLTDSVETSHHWQIFSNHNHGVCIIFDMDKLLSHFEESGLLHGPMIYSTIKYLKDDRNIPLFDLPFLKRDTFRSEGEYRVVSTNTLGLLAGPTAHVPLDISCIRRIVIGPTVPRELGLMLKRVIAEQAGKYEIKVTFSSLWNNRVWNEALNGAFRQAASEVTAA